MDRRVLAPPTLVALYVAMSLALASGAFAAQPSIFRETVSDVAEGEADVSALVEPDGESTVYHVEYGTSQAYGASTPDSQPVGPDGPGQTVTVHLVGLSAGTTYHFRFVAANEAGTTAGLDSVFNTYPASVPSGECPNEGRRLEQHAVYLPDCRAYEMVSPLDKNGSDIIGLNRTTLSSADGERAIYAALAGFGDTIGSGILSTTQYIASRETGGWNSRGLDPVPAREALQVEAGSTVVAGFSDDLSRAVMLGYALPEATGPAAATVSYYLENTATRVLQTITPPAISGLGPFGYEDSLRGYSADLRTVTFETTADLLPETTGTESKLYAWRDGEVTLAGVLPDGSVPVGGSGAAASRNSLGDIFENIGTVSDDGSRIAFVSSPSGAQQLYLRRDGKSTAWVSEPDDGVLAEPNDVRFQAMTPDGKEIVFLSSAPLVASDPGNGSFGLYVYRDGPSPQTEANLTFLARVGPEAGNQIPRSVLALSDDAKRVYFFSAGAIYLWEEGVVRFIASLDSAPKPGEVEASSDGTVLAFLSDAHIHEPQGLNADNTEMYVYDESAGKLSCASCARTGGLTQDAATVEPAATNAAFNLRLPIKVPFLSADGSRLFFSTPEPLVARDVNGVEDIYEYEPRSGGVSLVSPGTEQDGAWFASASVDGNDAFIVTRDQLVGSDTDSLTDLYDVRVGGGFPQPQPQTGGCVGDECQGVPSAVPSFDTASGFVGLGNVAVKARKGRIVSRARRLTLALKACRHKPRRVRKRCMGRARKRYGAGKAGKRRSSTTRR